MRRCCGLPSSQAKLELEKSAKLFAGAGMHAEAVQALVQRAHLSPQNPMIWNDLGVEYMSAGRTEEARKSFERAHKLFPDYPIPLYNLGRLALGHCIEEQAKPDASLEAAQKLAIEAIHYLRESLSIDPLFSQTHVLLAAAYEITGDDIRARLHMQEASKLAPAKSAEPKSVPLENLRRKTGKRAPRTVLPFVLSSGIDVIVGMS